MARSGAKKGLMCGLQASLRGRWMAPVIVTNPVLMQVQKPLEMPWLSWLADLRASVGTGISVSLGRQCVAIRMVLPGATALPHGVCRQKAGTLTARSSVEGGRSGGIIIGTGIGAQVSYGTDRLCARFDFGANP